MLDFERATTEPLNEPSNVSDAIRYSVINRAIFGDREQPCESWIVVNPVGGRPAGLDSRHVVKIMADILDKPIPQWSDPGTVSGEIDWR